MIPRELKSIQWMAFLLMSCFIGAAVGSFQGQNHGHNTLTERTTPMPSLGYISPAYFDISMPRNVTALVGKSAYLSCRVRNLGNKTVAWVRHRDIHVLTIGTYTYTSDQRFQTTHHKDTDEWTLHIKWAQPRDAGTYECQISSVPIRSYTVTLRVVDPSKQYDDFYGGASQRFYNDRPEPPYPYQQPRHPPNWYPPSGSDNWNNYYRRQTNGPPHFNVPTATILGGPDLYVDKGSTINLTCAIRFSPEPPAYIFWYHQDEVISYDSTRGGVSVITEKGEVTTSYLLLQDAELTDSGKYSCSPSNADVASVRVHVLNGERPEAMQTGSAGLSSSCVCISILIIISNIYNYLRVWLGLQSLHSDSHLR
ncbi:papilin-like isoform X1 [Phlebotomus argentipes]|uniref:papilin-like isoform X1 n=1 Tax=Phlebotomus argentipes TaxID=94469 RepID=UPI002892EADD|nr:papilin-like isoform X1 [Phlebotomus argentipes]